jgi:uncharacterized lipoprotein YmbA
LIVNVVLNVLFIYLDCEFANTLKLVYADWLVACARTERNITYPGLDISQDEISTISQNNWRQIGISRVVLVYKSEQLVYCMDRDWPGWTL